MKKKKAILGITGLLGVTAATVCVLQNVMAFTYKGKAEETTYTSTYNSSSGSNKKFTTDTSKRSGSKTLSTDLGYSCLDFTYKNISNYGGGSWQTVHQDGNFANTSKIRGLKKVKLSFDAIAPTKAYLYYDTKPIGNDLTGIKRKDVNVLNFEVTFTDEDNSPEYIKFVSSQGGDIDITLFQLTYSCEAVVRHTLTLSTNNDDWGKITSDTTITGVTGRKVTISTEAKSIQQFYGWVTEDLEIVSYEQTFEYTFKDNDEHLIALYDYALPGSLALELFTKDRNNYYRIKKLYGSAEEEVNIPSYARYQNHLLKITEIADDAFYEYESIREIKLPIFVNYIGKKAFYRCYIEKIKFPEELETIDSGAFQYNNFKNTVYLPDKLKTIGANAFSGKIGEISDTNIVIPISVETIGESAFALGSRYHIFCEATAQKSGWHSDWFGFGNTVYYYRENDPHGEEGHFWRYGDDGEPKPWY